MMFKKILLSALITLFVSMSYAQKTERIKGDRNVTIQETSINSFNRIVVGEDFKVDLIEGSEASVFIEADWNLHDIIEFTVADSTLSFRTNKRITSKKKIDIKVTYTNSLRQLETLDNGEISTLTSLDNDDIVLLNSGTSRAYLNIRTNNFKHINSERARVKLNLKSNITTLELAENSKLEALIESDTIKVDMYQRSDAKIEGETHLLEVTADNSSNFVGRALTSVDCVVIAGLNSDVYVQATENLILDASGSGEVYIYAEPKMVIKRFTGTSKLHKKELNIE
jgi:hypothetical protein